MLLNKRPLNSTPLNAVGTSALVVVADPAIATASCGNPVVLYGTITLDPIQAICTASAPNPNAGLGFFPSIDAGYGEGTGQDLVIPQVGFSMPQGGTEYGEGLGDDDIIPHVGISAQQAEQAYGEGEGQEGRIIFGVLAAVTTGVGTGTGQDLIIPQIGRSQPQGDQSYGEGEGQEIGTTLDDIVLHLSAYTGSSATIYDAWSATLVIDTEPVWAYASTHDLDVIYSSAVLNLAVHSYALAYPYYGDPILGTITIPTLSAYTETSARAYVVVTEPASDTVDLPPIQAHAYASAYGFAVQGTIQYHPTSPVATATAGNPGVAYGTLSLSPDPAVAVATTRVDVIFTDANIPTLQAYATASAPDPVFGTTTATVPKVSAITSASTHDPVVILGTIIPPPIFTKAYCTAQAYTGNVYQWTITIPTLEALATATATDPVVLFSGANLPKISAVATATAPDPTVEIEEIDHLTITPDPAIAYATCSVIALSEGLTVDLTGGLVVPVCHVGDHIVILGTLDFDTMTVETSSSVRYNRDLMEDELYKEFQMQPFYQVMLDRTSAGYTLLEGGESNMPPPEQIKVVAKITDDLLNLQRSGNIRIRGLVDLHNRLSFAMIDLTSALTNGTVGPITDFASINKAVAELAQQQNDVLRDIAELVSVMDSAQERMAFILGRMDNAIGNAIVPSDLSSNDTVTLLIEDKRF